MKRFLRFIQQVRDGDKLEHKMEFCGYVKANKLTSEYILRQDMEKREEAKIISRNEYTDERIKIDGQNIKIKNIVYNGDNTIEYGSKDWAVATNKLLESQMNSTIKDYKTRTELIDSLVNKVAINDLKGLIIDFNKIEDEFYMKRFIIELAPKLREIGIKTCIVINSNMKKDDFINIVDYIVE